MVFGLEWLGMMLVAGTFGNVILWTGKRNLSTASECGNGTWWHPRTQCKYIPQWLVMVTCGLPWLLGCSVILQKLLVALVSVLKQPTLVTTSGSCKVMLVKSVPPQQRAFL